ncbi:MAG: GntR family transcriptional regulator [Hyphomicrobiales bacterium]|nr:GntR family transcriptional regulator [Hyphomicrobiales bacterium]
MSGEIKPGQFVTQRELAKLVGVPLGAAREAIQRLEFESLLKVYPQRGIQVTEATTRLVRTAYGFRMLLEKEATRHFARTAPIEAIDTLIAATRKIVDRAEDPITRRLQEEAVEIDWQTHDIIIDSLDNEIVTESYRINAARIRLMRGVGNRLPPMRLVPALTEHLQILEACRARDEDKAVAEMIRHVETSLSFNFDPSFAGER